MLLSQSLHWPAFFNFLTNPKKKAHHSGRFFSADYEYLNHVFSARQDLPKFYVNSLKITLNSYFYLVLMLKKANSFNAMLA